MVALAAAGGDALRLTVPVTSPGTITGMVLNEATSALIEGARIVLVDTDFRTETNAAGRFSLEDLPPGAYRIRAVCAGYTGSVHEGTGRGRKHRRGPPAAHNGSRETRSVLDPAYTTFCFQRPRRKIQRPTTADSE